MTAGPILARARTKADAQVVVDRIRAVLRDAMTLPGSGREGGLDEQ